MFNEAFKLLLVGACVELQDRMIANLSASWTIDHDIIDMMDLTDRVICECGYGPEDWDALNYLHFEIPVNQQHWD